MMKSNEEEEDKEDKEEEEKEGDITLSKKVVQQLHVCSEQKKPRNLIKRIEKIREEEEKEGRKRNPSQIIVFCNRIKTVLFVYETLIRKEIKCTLLHG